MRKSFVLGLSFALLASAGYAIDFNPDCYQYGKSEVFASALQRFVSARNGDSWADEAKAGPTAGAAGYKYVTPQFTVGGTVSYEYGTQRNYAGPVYAKTRDETLGFTGFGEYHGPQGYYGKGSMFIGFNDKALWNYDLPGASGYGNDSDSSTLFGASVEFGKVFDLASAFQITPHAGFDYSYTPSTRVSGPGLELATASQSYYEIPLGVRFGKNFNVGNDWVLKPAVDLTFVSSVGHMDASNMNYQTGFASRTGSEWKVYGIGADHFGGRVTAGIDAVKGDRFDLGFNYTYEGRENYSDHRLGALFGVAF